MTQTVWRSRVGLSCIALATVLHSPRSSGQSPQQRQALHAWRETLQAATEVGTLSNLNAETVDPDGVVQQLSRALLTLRRAELTHSQSDYAAALFDFNQAGVRRSSWPWPSFGASLALASLRLNDWPPLPFDGLRDGDSYADAANRFLRESMERDPAFTEGRQAALGLLLAGGDRTLRPDAVAAVRAMLVTNDPGALIVWARYQRTERRYDSAEVYLNQAVARGGDPSVLGLELARTRRGRADTSGARVAYWAGVAQLTPAGRALYRQDLGWLLDPDSLAVFDRLPTDSVLPWLQRFWAERDALSARRPGERLIDHLGRWVVAHWSFRVPDPWRRTQFKRVVVAEPANCFPPDGAFWDRLTTLQPVLPGDIRSDERLLDYRGVALLRHGRPLARLIAESRGHESTGGRPVGNDASRIILGGLEVGDDPDRREDDVSLHRYESWLYQFEGRYRFLHFTGSEALGDYSTNTLGTYLPPNGADYELLSRFDPSYAEAARRTEGVGNSRSLCEVGKCRVIDAPANCSPWVQPVIHQARADANLAIRTDSDSPRLLQPWASAASFAAVGLAGTPSPTGVVVPFVVSRKPLQADSTGESRPRYSLRIRITGFNQRGGGSFVQDTTLRLEAGADSEFLSGLLELPLAPGSWTIGLLGDQGTEEAGFYTFRRGLRIDDGDGLRMSDVVLGLDRWRPLGHHAGGDVPVPPYPAWRSAAAIELYAEVGGLQTGSSYRTTIEIVPATPGRRGVKIQGESKAANSTVEIRRTISIARLSPGPYRLSVTVESGGRTTSREQEILIVK